MIPSITPEEVKKAIDTKEECIILDVRTPMEFSRGKLTGSINISVEDIQDKIESVIPDKNTRVYVYCLSGSRSIYAAQLMIQMGYTQVFDMPHGLLAWRIKGYSVA